jgi:hypothetical protein
MARSGAARQKAYLQRQREEQLQLRQRVHDLEGGLAAAHARIDELKRAQSEALRLTKTTPAAEVVEQLAGTLPDAKLAQIWVLLGERLKAATLRGRRSADEPPERRQERRLVKYLYPSSRRP